MANQTNKTSSNKKTESLTKNTTSTTRNTRKTSTQSSTSKSSNTKSTTTKRKYTKRTTQDDDTITKLKNAGILLSVGDTQIKSNQTKTSSQNKVDKQVEKVVKSTHWVTLLCVIMFLIIGIVAGFFTYQVITKEDKFQLIGDKEITINVGDTYEEKGITIIAFGKDISDKVVITGTVDTTTEGTYNIVYTVDNFKYKDVKRIRTINVVSDN